MHLASYCHVTTPQRSHATPKSTCTVLPSDRPKTIFFWAPAMKWGLVLAGLGDVNRPVEKVSLKQYGALAATGLIWSRFSLVIIPKNWSLFSVNILVFLTSGYQVLRAVRHQMNNPEVNDPKKKK